MTTGPSRWYVVQTHPHAEEKASAHLVRQGFEVYLPRYLKRRRHARKVDTVSAALFPRYLFVAMDVLAQRWRAVRSTFGVAHLISRGDEPIPVADEVMAGLRRREDPRGFVQLGPRFAAGDSVCIVSGVFADCLGLVEGMTDDERVAVLLDLLGRKVRVVMNAGLIEAT